MKLTEKLNILHDEIKSYDSYVVLKILSRLQKMQKENKTNEVYIPTDNELKSIINGYFIVNEMLFNHHMLFVSKKQAIEFLKKDFIPKAIGNVYASATSLQYDNSKDRQYFLDSMNAVDYVGFSMIISYALNKNFQESDSSIGESLEKTFNDNLASELWFKVMYSIYSCLYLFENYIITFLIWSGVFFLGWRLLCK